MLALHALQAKFGDCLLVEYGTRDDPRFALVDGGPDGTFQAHLGPVVADLPGHRLELLVLSHVDNDHAVGLVDLLAEMNGRRVQGKPPLVTIAAAWHNSFSRTLGDALLDRARETVNASPKRAGLMKVSPVIRAIGEGSEIAGFLDQLQIPLNAGFDGERVTVGAQAAPFASANLKTTVVGPTLKNLDALRKQWNKWLDDHEDEVSSGAIEPAAMSDRSVPNLSSIALLVEADGRTMLLTGDGRGDHLLDGLEEAGLLDDGRLHVDLLKLAHHGSDRDVTQKFFEQVTADRYVVSADGTYGNPDRDTLEWLLAAAKKQARTFTLYATNAPASLTEFSAAHPPDESGYRLELLGQGEHALRVPLSG